MAVDPANRFVISRLRGVATTANALRPFGYELPVAPWSFATGVVTSELPLVVGGVQLATGARRIAKGGFRGKRGLVGAGLTAASLAGLWRLHKEAQRSGDVLEAALREGLGQNYRDRIAEPFSPPPDVAMTRRQVLLPGGSVRRRYLAKGDVAYGDGGGRYRLAIDLDHEGWSGIILVTGRGPFPPDTVAPPIGARGPSWQQEFLAAAAEREWRVEMAWFQSVNRQSGDRAEIATGAAAGANKP